MDVNVLNGEKYIESVIDQINLWYQTTQVMSSTLLAIVSIGLIVSYIVLVHSICKYFKNQMQHEMKRLTILFATFVVAYILRFFYQLGLGSKFYAHTVHNMTTRWYLANAAPIIWDIVSIVSILMLHYVSFREPT